MAEEGNQLLDELMRFKPEGLTANAWAVQAGVGRTIWADLKRHGNPSRRTLSKLLEAVGSSLAEFEALRIGETAPPAAEGDGKLGDRGRGWRGAPPPAIPLLATSIAGEWGKAGSHIELHSIDRAWVVGKVNRPTALAANSDAYAVIIAGQSMWPRFRLGRRLLVSPSAAVNGGDDVLVELAGGKVLIKELVRRSASKVELRQFNPDVTFVVEMSGVAAVHKIVGEAL